MHFRHRGMSIFVHEKESCEFHIAYPGRHVSQFCGTHWPQFFHLEALRKACIEGSISRTDIRRIKDLQNY